jgi:histidyl-tRNA synthetase
MSGRDSESPPANPKSDERGGDKQQAVKGMNDLLPPDSAKWGFVEKRARATFENHGYREVRTPIVEYTPLFVRSIGDTTDVVEKEMYTFDDRDGKSLTMRPEGTAGAARAFLEHAVYAKDPVTRWYYAGPMFRHERAQKGRYRQFYQLGIEAYGVAEPTVEAEQVALLVALFQDLGIGGVETAVNNVGGPGDRPRFRDALVAFLGARQDALCTDCKRRLQTNPLRVLDCKVETCRAAVAEAPSILDHLSEPSRIHFEGLRRALDALAVPYRVEPKLVRGLDYYTGTVYEVRATQADLGNQNTLCGGGRYDNMIAEMGGPPTPAVGFAFGMERVVLALPGEADSFDGACDVFFAAHGDAARLYCLRQAADLRARGFRAEIEHRSASMKAQLRRADRLRARVVVVVGEQELEKQQVVVRDMKQGEQRTIAEADLVGELKRLLR